MHPATTRAQLRAPLQQVVRLDVEHARSKGYLPFFRTFASQEDVPLSLLLAVGSRESGIGRQLDADGVHPGGEWTIMGINTTAHPTFKERYSPTNHRAGVRKAASYLRSLKDEPGVPTWKGALTGYNAGLDDALQAEKTGRYDEHTTGDYVSDTLRRREILADLGFEGSADLDDFIPGGEKSLSAGQILAGGTITALVGGAVARRYFQREKG